MKSPRMAPVFARRAGSGSSATQVAALKALGYSNGELAWHYVKFALVIAAAGALAGIGLGMWLGAAMMGMYSEYFRFPVFQYRLSIDVAIGALGGSLVVGALGA